MKNIVKLKKKLNRLDKIRDFLTDHLDVGVSAGIGAGLGAIVGAVLGVIAAVGVGGALGAAAFFGSLIGCGLLGLVPGIYVIAPLGLLTLNILDARRYELISEIQELTDIAKHCDENNPDEVALYQKVQLLKVRQRVIEETREELNKQETAYEQEKNLLIKLYKKSNEKIDAEGEEKKAHTKKFVEHLGMADIVEEPHTDPFTTE